jgi:lipopolysaccharide export system permease protein
MSLSGDCADKNNPFRFVSWRWQGHARWRSITPADLGREGNPRFALTFVRWYRPSGTNRLVASRRVCDEPSTRVNLLDRYIFKGVLFTCAGAVGLFAFVLMMANIVKDLLGPLLAGQLGWGILPDLLLNLLLAVAPYALPMGILTGVMLTLGRLSADSEITAMRAAGISLARLMRPILILGGLSAALALYANFEAMPHGRVTFEQKLYEALRANPLRSIVPKTFIREHGKIFYIGEKNGPELHDIWFWQLDAEGRVTEFVRAESGRIEYDDATNELILTLNGGQAEQRNEKNPSDFSAEPPAFLSFGKSEPRRMPLDRIFGRATTKEKKPMWMTYDELRAEQERLDTNPPAPDDPKQLARDRMKISLTISDKFNTALAVLSFALIGVPLGIKVSRRETSANLGVAVMLALGYYFLTVMVNWIDRHPEYRPDLLLCLPNLIFIAIGVWLFRRIDQR